jgi:membrane protease subunit HflK
MRRRGMAGAVAGVLVLLVIYVASGFYFVQPDERAVVRWFGRVDDTQLRPPYGIGPGLHYALPWPLCRVDQPKTTEIRQVYVGMPPELREAIARGETSAMRVSPVSDVFTADVNILKVTMVVHYQVLNPVAYLLATERADELVRLTVQGVLIEQMATLPVDRALTDAKAKLENDTWACSQALLDAYGCGVQLVATSLESIEPPRAIDSAFKDVVSAKKDGEKVIDRAIAEANRILPRARGDAAEILEDAQAFYQKRVKRAHGEAESFLDLLTEYQQAPDVTAVRLRLQTFEKVLANVRKVIVDNKPGEPPTRIRIIDESPE